MKPLLVFTAPKALETPKAGFFILKKGGLSKTAFYNKNGCFYYLVDMGALASPFIKKRVIFCSYPEPSGNSTANTGFLMFSDGTLVWTNGQV
ncbi:MAG: hypothetical protein M1G31_10650 [Pseudanabaena sp. Salubria-1]|nr:hypothetical protein [Pseudanabaena sp. Salubria-1]